VKHLILALLAATFSLSVTAATTVKSTKSNTSDRVDEPQQEQKTIKTTKSNTFREPALQGADSCQSTANEKGRNSGHVGASERQHQECKDKSKDSSNERIEGPKPTRPAQLR